jgi:hypothetical protein
MNYKDGSAFCSTTISQKNYSLTKDEWEQKRVGMVTTNIETLADIKRLIRQACSQLKCVVDKTNNRLIINLEDK